MDSFVRNTKFPPRIKYICGRARRGLAISVKDIKQRRLLTPFLRSYKPLLIKIPEQPAMMNVQIQANLRFVFIIKRLVPDDFSDLMKSRWLQPFLIACLACDWGRLMCYCFNRPERNKS